MIVLLFGLLASVNAGPATDSYKNQFCTDPRTMREHAAYTEWADAYSCTRHRCQPGGRNLAIYTVGCKRVEAPESAIECEEVVEDTNMQFPFCCTRLRCLVVVRGEVWTRVLGQPWESLPAAPWSHMYKMKKPPPSDGTFGPKSNVLGPIYELAPDSQSSAQGPREKVLRTSEVATTESAAPTAPKLRAALPPPPDIVIALSTGSDPKELKMNENVGNRYKRIHKEAIPRASSYVEEISDREDKEHADTETDFEDNVVTTEKSANIPEPEGDTYGDTHNNMPRHQSWTDIPQSQWNEHEQASDTDSNKETYNQQELDSKPGDKPGNLQALVDAIGSRMRDIENVVQKMSEKVHKPGEDDKGSVGEEESTQKKHKGGDVKDYNHTKKPGLDDHYKRFSVRNRGSKYVHTTDSTTEAPLFVEDAHMNGYFSDASNSVLRRTNGPKEPVQSYIMAPVDTRRKSHTETSEEKKRKKHQHKKKKGKHHKKHHSKKKFNRLSSSEVDKNMVSLEDSSAGGN